jgi:NAD(P)H-flavin reductase
LTSSNTQVQANPWLTHSVRVQLVLTETPGVATYELVFIDPAVASEYRFMPGQFNMLYVPGVGEAAISISSAPHTPQVLRHTIREVGGVTQAIAAGGRGMSLGLRGPFGSHWPVDACLLPTNDCATKRDVIIVAGGIGLAPLRSAIYALCRHRDQVGRIVVMVGARTPNDLLFQQEYVLWREQGVEVQTTVDRATADWQGNIGVVTGLLNRLLLNHPENTVLMTCGPEVMMRYVVSSALQRKIPPSNLWLSLERNMNCAVGLCGHCQLGPDFLCKNGPVLPYTHVAPWLKVQAL